MWPRSMLRPCSFHKVAIFSHQFEKGFLSQSSAWNFFRKNEFQTNLQVSAGKLFMVSCNNPSWLSTQILCVFSLIQLHSMLLKLRILSSQTSAFLVRNWGNVQLIGRWTSARQDVSTLALMTQLHFTCIWIYIILQPAISYRWPRTHPYAMTPHTSICNEHWSSGSRGARYRVLCVTQGTPRDVSGFSVTSCTRLQSLVFLEENSVLQ